MEPRHLAAYNNVRNNGFQPEEVSSFLRQIIYRENVTDNYIGQVITIMTTAIRLVGMPFEQVFGMSINLIMIHGSNPVFDPHGRSLLALGLFMINGLNPNFILNSGESLFVNAIRSGNNAMAALVQSNLSFRSTTEDIAAVNQQLRELESIRDQMYN